MEVAYSKIPESNLLFTAQKQCVKETRSSEQESWNLPPSYMQISTGILTLVSWYKFN